MAFPREVPNQEALDNLINMAHRHNQRQLRMAGDGFKGSLWQYGCRAAIQGHINQARGLMLPFLQAGPNTSDFQFQKFGEPLKAGKGYGSLIRLVSNKLKTNLESLRQLYPPQCNFLGTKGGTPGAKHFFPYAAPGAARVITTDRPQIELDIGKGKRVRLDDCHYWHHLLSMLRAEVTNWEQDVSVQQQLQEQDGWSSPDNVAHYRYKELKFIERLATEFRNRQGVRWDRLRERFEQRLSAARNSVGPPTECPFLQACIALRDEKPIMDLWAETTLHEIENIRNFLDAQVHPSRPATLADYDNYVGNTFATHNPSMQALMSEARSDA